MAKSNREVRVAVILSGCGVYDGSEVYESVLTLLRLDQLGAKIHCFAPNMDQMHVVNHLTGEEVSGESRNVLVEASRIVRGDIEDIANASMDDFDALIVPGGFGVAKNLSSFAVDGAAMSIDKNLVRLVNSARQAKKPIGLICIAPAMSGLLFGDGVQCTIGHDVETANVLAQTGAVHVNCNVDNVHIDHRHNLVTTPAYMLAQRISDAAVGINKLVDTVLEMT
jgi:enhancing lycopene biosynthesis protein 2